MGWINDVVIPDAVAPKGSVEGLPVYTLYLRDFLKMPNIDFDKLSKSDTHLKTLKN